MTETFRACLCGILILGMGALQGCSKGTSSRGPAVGSLAGKVTYKGKALTGGNLILKNKEKGDSVIQINADGTFEGNAIPVGETVAVAVDTEPVKGWLEGARKGKAMKFDAKDIEKIKASKGDPLKFAEDPFKGMEYVPIPKKYTNPLESGLSVTIKEGKNPDKIFALE